MAKGPWLTIIGFGEDGLDGLPAASLDALNCAELVMGPVRHLSLLGDVPQQTIDWPVPFSDGLEILRSLRGRRVVVLASGDPFWYGAGSVLARDFDPIEWVALPGLSCFSIAAARLGWPLDTTPCLGLHAAPLSRLRPYLARGTRLIVTLRDGAAFDDLHAYLTQLGFGDSILHVMEALAGPRERISKFKADEAPNTDFAHPVCVAIDVQGAGESLPKTSGRSDAWFAHDGQITKRPVRALTLSALAPRHGEHLWDIGGGSGSIAIEWLLADPSLHATCIEADPARADRITKNAVGLGVDRLHLAIGVAPKVLDDLEHPDVVFVGGGLSNEMLAYLTTLRPGTRIVANAVTLEAEALLASAQAIHGGDLLRIELAQNVPLGRKRGWKSSYPIVQWSVTL